MIIDTVSVVMQSQGRQGSDLNVALMCTTPVGQLVNEDRTMQNEVVVMAVREW